MGNLADQLDAEFAPGWKPEPGDKIEGVITGLSEREGNFGKYPIATIRQDNGEEIAAHCYHAVLASKLAELRPRVGERVALKYLGQVAKTGGGSYHSYRAVVDRPRGTAIDWGQYDDGQQQRDWAEDVDGRYSSPSSPPVGRPVEDSEDLPF
jgi:hypothetical protein